MEETRLAINDQNLFFVILRFLTKLLKKLCSLLDWWWRTSGWTTADQVMRFSHSHCTKSLYVFVACQGHFPYKLQIYVWWWPLLTGQFVTDVLAVNISWVLLQYPPLFATLLLFQKKYSVLNCRKQIKKTNMSIHKVLWLRIRHPR